MLGDGGGGAQWGPYPGASQYDPSGGTANSMNANLPQPYQNLGGATPWDPSGGTANSQGANFMPVDQASPLGPSTAVTQPAAGATGTPGTLPANNGVGTHATVAQPHHSYQEFMPGGSSFGQLISDPAYVQQKAALLGKLGDYERNVASQIGGQNLTAVTNSPDALTGAVYGYNGRALAPDGLFNDTKDANGDDSFTSKGALYGGTLGSQYDTALANFNNQQAMGLRNTAEDFAARGMLGSGSGVWQTARNNLQDQYRNQLGNINDSTVNQYNNILAGMNDQYSQGRNTLQGYATDASNRIATGLNNNLPTAVQ